MQQIDMSNEKPMVSAYPPRPLPSREAGAMRGANPPRVRYSAACPTGAERNVSANAGLARLSCVGNYSLFSYGNDIIRFATSPRLVKYTRIKKWDDGYLEVGADYGTGEVEDYIDIRAILDNLYYDTDAFLSKIDKVEVVHE